jgi:hypothetical protein
MPLIRKPKKQTLIAKKSSKKCSDISSRLLRFLEHPQTMPARGRMDKLQIRAAQVVAARSLTTSTLIIKQDDDVADRAVP